MGNLILNTGNYYLIKFLYVLKVFDFVIKYVLMVPDLTSYFKELQTSGGQYECLDMHIRIMYM